MFLIIFNIFLSIKSGIYANSLTNFNTPKLVETLTNINFVTIVKKLLW
jgi:hypothetical protein